MLKNIKLLSLLVPVAAAFFVVIGFSSTTYASGEKWELIDSSTIRVSGGAFSGPLATKNGTIDNPSSITLKLISTPNTDPSIWQATTSFNLGASNNGVNYYLEDKPREVGQFCVDVNNFSLLLTGREAATFQIIHREDCGKPYSQMRYISPSNTQYMRCGGFMNIGDWRCNTMWSSAQTGALSGDAKITYAIPGAPLKCGDPGFVGPCAQPYNPVTADCTKTDGSAGAERKCEAIKGCVRDATKAVADCTKAWDDCVASYTSNKQDVNWNSCESFIAKGDFEGGKYQKPADKTNGGCNVEGGIGWIICPISTSIAKGVDAIFNLVKTFLEFHTFTTNTTSGLYKSWAAMRNIANVAFVIVFMIIIFSQLSSVGISNYGIKKMLPRLIVAAILVNASYWICGIAVDLSNIIGGSIGPFFRYIQGGMNGSTLDVNWADAIGTVLAGVGVGAFAVGAGVAAAAASGALLWMAVPVVIGALFSVVVAFLILAARQVLLIILIVISPLAFVAYLLPNTSKWFDKWKDAFVTLLLMYPIIALIFAGAQLASAVILSAGQISMIQVIFALAIQVIPLALTPFVVKFSGGLLGKFAGMINNPNRGPLDRIRNYSKEKAELATKKGIANGTGWINRMGQRRDFRRRRDALHGKQYEATSEANWQERIATNGALLNSLNETQAQTARTSEAQIAQKKAYLQALRGSPDLVETAAGVGGEKATSKIMAAVLAAEVEEFNKTVESEKKTMSTKNAGELHTIMRDVRESDERRAAAAGQLMKVGGDNDIHTALEYLGTQPKSDTIKAIQQQVAADIGSRKPVSLGAADISNLAQGAYDGDFASKIAGRLSKGKLSSQSLAQASADELIKIRDYVQANGSTLKADPKTADALKALETDIAEFRTNPQLQGQQPSHEIASLMDQIHGAL